MRFKSGLSVRVVDFSQYEVEGPPPSTEPVNKPLSQKKKRRVLDKSSAGVLMNFKQPLGLKGEPHTIHLTVHLFRISRKKMNFFDDRSSLNHHRGALHL